MPDIATTITVMDACAKARIPVVLVPGATPPDRPAGGWELTAPLATRFCHLDFSPPYQDWLDGITTGWATPASRAVDCDRARRAAPRAIVAGFIHVRPDLLHDF